MFAIRRLDCSNGESHLLLPAAGETETALRAEADEYNREEDADELAYFVVEVQD
jgi:hypothetical protein